MKILLLGDASNYHATLASALSAKGHDVTLASDGSRWMNTRRDIDLTRRPGKIGGAILYARMSTVLAQRMKGFDVVQLASPGFVQLQPARLEKILRRLKRDNGSIYLTALGTDSAYVRNLTGPAPALAYSEWQIGHSRTPWSLDARSEADQWLAPELQRYTDAVYSSIDGAVSALYEYHRVIEAEYAALPLAYGGIPIDFSILPASHPHTFDDKIRILYACHRGREQEKGADILLPLLQRLQREFPGRIELQSPANMPFADFVKELAAADIVCDQLYSYTPATTALMAMATGAVPISGGEDEFYKFIGEPDQATRPIINLTPGDTEAAYSQLRNIASDTARLQAMSAAAPDFVRRHNSANVVADRFISFWKA